MPRCECLQCGYDLTPLVRSVRESVVCPECGHSGPPVPIGFMGVLRSRPRTLLYMMLPMLIAGPCVLLLRILNFPAYGLPMLVGVPAAFIVPPVIATTREGRARGKPIWGETLLLLLMAWGGSASIYYFTLMLARFW